MCDVNLVAIGTRNLVVVMSTAVPGETRIAAVAIEAYAILLTDRGCRAGSKTYDRRSLLAATDATRVLASRSVAGLTLQLPSAKGAARIGWHRVRRFEY